MYSEAGFKLLFINKMEAKKNSRKPNKYVPHFFSDDIPVRFSQFSNHFPNENLNITAKMETLSKFYSLDLKFIAYNSFIFIHRTSKLIEEYFVSDHFTRSYRGSNPGRCVTP